MTTKKITFTYMKTILLPMFCIVLLFIACKENKKTVIHQKPSFDSIGKMPYEKAVLLYGKPLSTVTFDNADQGQVFSGNRA